MTAERWTPERIRITRAWAEDLKRSGPEHRHGEIIVELCNALDAQQAELYAARLVRERIQDVLNVYHMLLPEIDDARYHITASKRTHQRLIEAVDAYDALRGEDQS